MYCKNCGKKLEDDWTTCPYCNEKVKEEEGKEEELKAVLKDDQPLPVGILKLEKFNFIKYLLLSLVTFGIYGIVVLYRFTKTVNILCEGDGKESPNYIVVYLLNIATIGVYGIYWIHKQAERLNDIAPKYNSVLSLNATAVLIWSTFGNFIGVGPFIAWYLMFKNINLLIDNYKDHRNTDFSFNQIPKRSHAKVVGILVGYYILFFVLGFLVMTIVTVSAVFDDSSEDLYEIDKNKLSETENDMSDNNSAKEENNNDSEEFTKESDIMPNDARENKSGDGENSPKKYYESTIKFLIEHPGMSGNEKVKVYGTFSSKHEIYIASGGEKVEVKYDRPAYDEAGNEVGIVSTGDIGYVVGTYILDGDTYIEADRIVLTDNIPEDFMPEEISPESEYNDQDYTFIGVEGVYNDFTYGSAYSSEIYIYISDMTEDTFWFVIFNGDDPIFAHNMAEITGDNTAVFNGTQYTLNFTWNGEAELSITGFPQTENMTFINNSYLQVS